MEQRIAKIISNKSGGNASGNSKTHRITIPNSWINALNLTDEALISFDGEQIIISPVLSIEEYEEKNANNKLVKINYYNFDELCTIIIANYTKKEIVINNLTDIAINKAFGNNRNPKWEDYESLLEDRCIPKNRENIKSYLNTLGLDEYNPLEIIKITGGKMANDNKHIALEEL